MDCQGNLFDMRLESEMPGIKHLDNCIGVVAPVGFGSRRNKERIIFPSNCEQWRPGVAEISLKRRIKGQVGRVV